MKQAPTLVLYVVFAVFLVQPIFFWFFDRTKKNRFSRSLGIRERAAERLACQAEVHPDVRTFTLKGWEGEDPDGMLLRFPCQAGFTMSI